MRRILRPSPNTLAVLCGGVVGCGFRPETSWTEQLTPGGPCWAVDLSDGLEEDSTRELQWMVDCFDKGDILQPVRPVTDALDAEDPNGEVVGLALIRDLNALLSGGLDLAVAVQEIADRLAELDTAIELGTRVFVELTYAVPYRSLGPETTLADPAALEGGLIYPAIPVVGDLARQAVTDDGALMSAVHDTLEHPAVPDLACTVLAVGRSADPTIQASLDGLPAALGHAREATRSPENDRWGYASGDSLRDFTGRLLANDAERWHMLAEPLARMLREDDLGPPVEEAFRTVIEAGHLDQLPLQLRYLATIDRTGAPVGPAGGADGTAWTSLLRLLSNANAPAECSIDIGVTELEIDLGNVAVLLLETFARQDPEVAEGALDLFSGILGFPLTDEILDLVAGSGACPVLDHRFVDDLQVIDRLTDRETRDLLFAAIQILAALEGGDARESSIPLLVDTLDAFYVAGLAEPTGELLIDLGDTELTNTLVGSLPWMIDPRSLSAGQCPIGTTPITFLSGWNLLDDVVSPRSDAAALARIGPTFAGLLRDDRLWDLVDNTTPLLVSTDALVHRVPGTLVDGIADTPSLEGYETFLTVLNDQSAWMPYMALAATPEVTDGLRNTDAPQGGPLPYLSRLVIDGTLDDLMRTIALAAELLAGEPVTNP